MPILNAGATVTLGPYNKGAKLTISLPLTGNIHQFPTLNTVVITLNPNVPKTVTLAQGTVYRLTAGTAQITYSTS